jgi:biotin carboxyl carrier protein
MECVAESPKPPTKALESLAGLQQLALEAGLSDSRKQLIFRMLNRSIIYCRYDRAVLWSLTGRMPKLLGVSGNCNVDSSSRVAGEWRDLIGAMSNRQKPRILEPGMFGDRKATWQTLAGRTNGLSVAWLPIKVDDRTVAGLWLERWGGSWFADADLAALETLALSYGIAWKAVVRRPNRLIGVLRSRRRATTIGVAASLILAACFIKVPLRIVAHCEVVPRDPVAITAPLNGVIDEIPVLPGRSVEKGELLAVYDQRVAVEQLKVAREQVQIIASDLQRSRVQAFEDPSARAAIALLENRLEQEQIRLRITEHQVAQSEVRAPVSGTLMFDDPHQWRGRPVQVGQRLMMIIDPAKTKLRIWLPDSDNIDFDRNRTLTVILDSDPSTSRSARLRFLAPHSQVDKSGKPCFKAEAEWVNPGRNLKMGLQGTAVMYGQRVSLGYWLLRRPLAALRRHLGF